MAIALVQHGNLDQASAASAALAYASNPALNNLLIVAARVGGGTNETSITVSDTIGNTWTQLTVVTSGTMFNLVIWYAVNKSSAADTITVSVSPNTTIRMAIYEYSGTATSNPLDVQGNATGSSTAPASSSITPAANNELIFAAACSNITETFTGGANFTLEDAVPASPNSKLATEDWVQTTATATTGPFTMSASDSWGAIVAAFKAAPSGQVFFSLPDDGEQFQGVLPTPNILAADDWLPVVPQPPLFEWDESQRWQLRNDYQISLTTSEEDTGLLPLIPNIVYDDDPSRSFEARQQQDDEPWHTFFLIPAPPPNFGWDDWDWSKDYSAVYAKPPEGEPFDFSLPTIPAMGWFDEPQAVYGQAGLSALVVLDEFVRAPAATPFGPAPLGRSARFSFSNSAFR